MHLHQENWDFYFCNIEGKLASIYVDLGMKDIAPVKGLINILWVSLQMENPGQYGLTSHEESDTLVEIEESLASALREKHDCLYVGRLTSDSNRDFYFYIGDTMLVDKTVSDTLINFPNYQYDYGVKKDRMWHGYFDFLYPEPHQMQIMQNRNVVEQLEIQGDKLEKPRPVDHWIFFCKEADRERFIEGAASEGFSIEEKDFDPENNEQPYILRVSRTDKVDYQNIDNYTLFLWELAKQCNGVYDGWETTVETD